MKHFIYVLSVIFLSACSSWGSVDSRDNLEDLPEINLAPKLVDKIDTFRQKLVNQTFWASPKLKNLKNGEKFLVVQETPNVDIINKRIQEVAKNGCYPANFIINEVEFKVFYDLQIVQEDHPNTITEVYSVSIDCRILQDLDEEDDFVAKVEFRGYYFPIESGSEVEEKQQFQNVPSNNQAITDFYASHQKADMGLYLDDPLANIRNDQKAVKAINNREVYKGMKAEFVVLSLGEPQSISDHFDLYEVRNVRFSYPSGFITLVQGKVSSWELDSTQK